ncbi:MAG: hypothetical protein HC919_08175 [Oscillatoriales cyanobacterium SM2_2_1]|nr:hypothetical protein [Oscillatoriales cyanobacterium SM2_2_1]
MPNLQQQIWRSWLRLLTQEKGFPLWVWAVLLLAVMLFWNWELVIATAVGMVLLLLVYGAQSWPWIKIWAYGERLWQHPQRALVISTLAGVVGVLGAYLTVHLGVTTGNIWLSVALLVQMLLSIGVFLLLVQQSAQRHTLSLETLLQQAVAEDAPVRLVGIRQLTCYARVHLLLPEQQRAIMGTCQLLLEQETVPLVREALVETLAELPALQVD